MMSDALADPHAARAHARSQAGATAVAMPVLPPSAADGWPEGMDPSAALWAETVAGGGYTALTVRRGARIALVDVDGDASPHVVLVSALDPTERLNVADTVKVQWQAYPTAGAALLSDRGRVLARIVEDGSGLHDAFTGTSTLARNGARYGAGDAHSATPAGRELLTLAALKVGLERRDLPTGITFFQQVRVGRDGRFGDPERAGAGARIVLHAEMPLHLLLANVPHPLDPRGDYTVTPTRLRVWAAADAPGRTPDPEVERALRNTESYLALRGE